MRDRQGKRGRALLKIEIHWRARTANVTSLTGGHAAQCLDLGDKMELVINALPVRRGPAKERKRNGRQK